MAEKKLARSANKKLAGVCGGLAEYFGFDASIDYFAVEVCTYEANLVAVFSCGERECGAHHSRADYCNC